MHSKCPGDYPGGSSWLMADPSANCSSSGTCETLRNSLHTSLMKGQGVSVVESAFAVGESGHAKGESKAECDVPIRGGQNFPQIQIRIPQFIRFPLEIFHLGFHASR